MLHHVYDFVDGTGRDVIDDWLSGLDKVLCARMRLKIDMLMNTDGDLPPKMLTDTKNPHIKELRVNSKEALRVLLCRGRGSKQGVLEYTLLFGAVERDRKYVPKNALDVADANRKLVQQDPLRYRKIRVSKHADPS